MMRRIWDALRRFWEGDLGLSVVLGLLVLLVFVLPPLTQGRGRTLLFDAAFSLLLVAGVTSAAGRPGVRVVLLFVMASALGVRWTPASSEAAVELSSLVAVGLLAGVVLAQSFRRGPVNVHRVLGAVAAYLLLGLAWAFAYAFVAALHPDAFRGAEALAEDPRGWVYFSFVTLTTVGFGDVTPVHPAARSLAMLEALTGQLYPAILLARLVALVQTKEED